MLNIDHNVIKWYVGTKVKRRYYKFITLLNPQHAFLSGMHLIIAQVILKTTDYVHNIKFNVCNLLCCNNNLKILIAHKHDLHGMHGMISIYFLITVQFCQNSMFSSLNFTMSYMVTFSMIIFCFFLSYIT